MSAPWACARAPTRCSRELAEYSSVPIFNMLTALHHPCQALADLLTLREALGTFEGAQIAYVGDGNNVARSLALLGTLAGLDVAVASPPGYALEEDLALLDGATGSLELHTDPLEAVAGAQARLHRRVGQHGRRGDRRRAPHGARALPGR